MHLPLLHRRVLEFTRKHELLRPGDVVVVGVSGGPDSVALVHMLKAMSDRGGPPSEVVVGHLHHGLRGEEADRDAAFVRDLARSLGLRLVSDRRDVHKEAAEMGRSVEDAARRARYAFLENAAHKADARAVAVGHHLDDQAETVLQRLLSGCSVLGLAAMQPKRRLSRDSPIVLVRPLLSVRRTEILAYLTQCNIPYRTDRTNEDVAFQRNRIRHEVLPLIRECVNPAVDEALASLAVSAQEVSRFLEEKAWEIIQSGPLDVEKFASAPPALRMHMLCELIRSQGYDVPRLARRHIEDVAAMCTRAREGAGVCLPGGVRIEAKSGRLRAVLECARSPVEKLCVELRVPGSTHAGDLVFEAEMLSADISCIVPTGAKSSRWVEVVDADKVALPLRVRQRRPGDRFWPLGARGESKLKDFFVNAKVPVELRDSIPIVVAEDRPIWVVGYRIDQRVSLDEHTKRAIRLECRRAGNVERPE